MKINEVITTTSYDTIYLSPKLFNQFDENLKLVEHQCGMLRVEIKQVPVPSSLRAPANYQGYQVHYQKGNGKPREFKRQLKQLWKDFPNPLSRHWK